MQFSRLNRVFKYWCVRLDIKKWQSSTLIMNTAEKDLKTSNNFHVLQNLEEDTIVKKNEVDNICEHYENISEYLNSTPDLKYLKTKISPHLLQRKFDYSNTIFIIDNYVANVIFKTLKPHLESYNGHIIEVNAGVGVFTRYLLNAKLQRLRIYEADAAFYSDLFVSALNSKLDAKVIRLNLLTLPKLQRLDQHDYKDRIGSAFGDLPTLSWEDDPVMKMIVTVPSINFLWYIMWSIINQSGICVYGRPQLFVTMPPVVYYKITAESDDGYFLYSSKSALFQILFDIKVLKRLPQKAFIPWLNRTKKVKLFEMKLNKEKYKDYMYLVEITARQDLLQKVPVHMLRPLWFFLNVMLHKRKSNLITSMEKWIPGYGVKLISQGHTIYTECGMVKPDKFIQIFMDFSSTPEFMTFLSTMQSILVNMALPGCTEESTLERLRQGRKNDVDIEDNSLDMYNLIEHDQIDNKTDKEENEKR